MEGCTARGGVPGWGERQAAAAQSRIAALTALLLGLGLMGAGWLVSRRAV